MEKCVISLVISLDHPCPDIFILAQTLLTQYSNTALTHVMVDKEPHCCCALVSGGTGLPLMPPLTVLLFSLELGHLLINM